jgi:Fe2+ or Zn2+ uptake regulation protein
VDDARVQRLIATLRQRGGRVTSARRAVVAALVEAEGHVTADQLADTVQTNQPDVHLSTIYRTLEALEHLGIVDHTHLGHGRAVYHLADDPHQHLVCELCGRVVEVPDDTFTDLGRVLRRTYGFTIRPSHFAVLGRCAACTGVTAPASVGG